MIKFIFSVIGFIIGFILKGIFENWQTLQLTFFNITIIDVAQLLITIMIGCYITYYISNKISTEQKRKEIILNQTEEFAQSIREIYKTTCEYIAKPTNEKARIILAKFKNASFFIDAIEKKLTKKILKHHITNCQFQFLSLKASITDVPFMAKDSKFCDKDIANINEIYKRLYFAVDEFKFKIYT